MNENEVQKNERVQWTDSIIVDKDLFPDLGTKCLLIEEMFSDEDLMLWLNSLG